MKFLVMVKATPESEQGVMPEAKMFEDMGRFNEELLKAGVLLAAEGLKQSKFGARVQFDGKSRTVVDGPFSETKELVAGFWLWECKDLAEALEWVKRCPNPMPGPSEIEVRPVMSLEDFSEVMTPELIEEQLSRRAELAAQQRS